MNALTKIMTTKLTELPKNKKNNCICNNSGQGIKMVKKKQKINIMKKFKISQESFLKLLDPLSAIVNDNHLIPILQCVKVEIHKGEIFVTGDNSEINCVNIAVIESDLKISFCTSFNILLSVLKSINKQFLEIEIDGNNLIITHGKGVFKLPLHNISEFPKLPKEQFKKIAEIKGAQLKAALKVANKFILNSEMEPFANISIDISKGITIRSSNKISLFKEKIKGKGDPQSILIGGKSSNSILSLISDKKVIMQYNNEKIFFKSKDREIMVIQQQGEFPLKAFDDILKTIGNEDSNALKVDSEDLVASLKRNSILSNIENSVKLHFTKKEVEISCINKDTSSESHELLACKFPKDYIVGYDAKLLIEVLQVFGKETQFSINKANCFCLENDGKKGLLAPILLKN